MFHDFRLLHGAAEAIPLTDVTQSIFVVVYGHFGLDTICLLFPCFSILRPALVTPINAALVIYSLSLFYSGAPHSCIFFISSFSPILPSLSPS